jgi:hypothetical protein
LVPAVIDGAPPREPSVASIKTHLPCGLILILSQRFNHTIRYEIPCSRDGGNPNSRLNALLK